MPDIVKPSAALRCFDHPDADAVGICAVCGKPVCAICRRMLGSKIACPACATQCVADLAAAPATECSNLGDHIEHSTEGPHLHRGDTLTTRPPDTLPEVTTPTSRLEEYSSSAEIQRSAKDPATTALAMNCYLHPQADAVAVCVSCGKPVCTTCRRTLGIRSYCPTCTQQRLAAGNQARTDYGTYETHGTYGAHATYATLTTGRSGKLTAAGVLSIVGGSISMFGIVLFWLLVGTDSEESSSASDLMVGLVILSAIPVALCIMSIIGGICALKRKAYGLALAGAICGLIASVPLVVLGGIPPIVLFILAIVFLSQSKAQFRKSPPLSQAVSQPWMTQQGQPPR